VLEYAEPLTLWLPTRDWIALRFMLAMFALVGDIYIIVSEVSILLKL